MGEIDSILKTIQALVENDSKTVAALRNLSESMRSVFVEVDNLRARVAILENRLDKKPLKLLNLEDS